MHGRFLVGIAALSTLLAVGSGHPVLVRLSWTLWGFIGLAALISLTALRGITVERRTRSARAEVGGLLEETLRVSNQSWLPKLWLEIGDASELPGHHAGRAVASLAPGASRSWTVRTVCRRRGQFRLGPITLSGGDPLGIFRRQELLPDQASVVVLPRCWSLAGLELPTGYLSGGQVVRRPTDMATSNVRGVRGYRPGDTFSRVHWPTTARRGHLHTKEFELDPLADYWVLLDMEAAVHTGEVPDSDEAIDIWAERAPDEEALPPTSEEYAVSAAASLARHFLDAGRSVGLISHAQRRVLVPPDRGERQALKLLGQLAVLRAKGRAALSEVLSAESSALTRHSSLLLVTPSTSARWVPALRELRLRGVGTLVVLVEPSSFGPGGSCDAVAEALVAERFAVRRLSRGLPVGPALVA